MLSKPKYKDVKRAHVTVVTIRINPPTQRISRILQSTNSFVNTRCMENLLFSASWHTAFRPWVLRRPKAKTVRKVRCRRVDGVAGGFVFC